jgi:predicted transcriptional regulator
LRIEDEIENSLDVLAERYESMSKILEKEVFFDSVEVRQVIEDIRISHESILLIANNLTQNFLDKNEIEEKNSKNS